MGLGCVPYLPKVYKDYIASSFSVTTISVTAIIYASSEVLLIF